MSLASVLPFLAQLKKGVPDFSSMVSDSEQPIGPPLQPQQAAPIPDTPTDMSSLNPPAQPQASGMPDTPTDMSSANAPGPPKETKGHALLSILRSGLVGGLSGLSANAQTYSATGRNAGFGGGAGAGFMQSLPMQAAFQQLGLQKAGLENEQLIQMLPFLRAQQIAGLNVKTSEAQKNTAEAGKAGAEAGAVATKQALEQAQANAAKYQKVGDSLYDVSSSTPQMVAGSTAILDAPTARVLGRNPGDVVPLDVATKGKQLVDQGLTYQQANGHNWLVDKQGNKLKDMGVATPMAIINAQMNAPAQVTPEMSQAAGRVAAGKIDLATALAPFRRFPGQSEAFMNEVFRQNPDYNQATYGVSKKTMDYFTTGAGANELTAFRTAIAHADLLKQAAQELNNNGPTRTFDGLVNRLQSEFGDPRLTTFDAIANAYNHEVTSAISKGHITNNEVETGHATMPSNANFETISSVADAYKSLMASKAQQRMIQYEQGLQGKAAFPSGISTTGGKKGDPLGLF